jgi:hypothetical protein
MKRAKSGKDDTQSVAKEYKVGNPLIVMLDDGRIVEAKIRAVIEGHPSVRLQVDYGHDETVLIHEKQLKKE